MSNSKLFLCWSDNLLENRQVLLGNGSIVFMKSLLPKEQSASDGDNNNKNDNDNNKNNNNNNINPSDFKSLDTIAPLEITSTTTTAAIPNNNNELLATYYF